MSLATGATVATVKGLPPWTYSDFSSSSPQGSSPPVGAPGYGWTAGTTHDTKTSTICGTQTTSSATGNDMVTILMWACIVLPVGAALVWATIGGRR